MEKESFSYVLSKQIYYNISDGHLWFSIFNRPLSNKFTRVQRCTCCFVLLFISMFFNIMYYDLTKEDNYNVSLSFGPFYLTLQQILIGIIIEFLSLLVSLFLVQFFRHIRSRENEISSLKDKKLKLMFPWWCLFISYGLSLILISVSIFFIINSTWN